METIWLALLGALLAGYLVLGGYDYGVQLLHAALSRGEGERRLALNTFGPFFLGNEVWLVAFAGVMAGAFPHAEAALLPSLHLPVAGLLGGVVVGTVAVQLRSRHRSRPARVLWGALAAAGGLVAAAGWGLLTGILLGGSSARLFVLLCAVATLTLFAGHGAAFLAMRSGGPLRGRALRAGVPLLAAAAAAILAAAGVGAVTHLAATGWILAAPPAVQVVLLLLGTFALRREAPVWAFAATSGAAALMAPIILAASGAGMSLAETAADPTTLRLLLPVAVLVIPLLLTLQAVGWWAFRDRPPTYL
ncbi:cytochrome d ubiquinol oxidase subunit II [Nonomuraea helvata]|uniref:Cytochrome d ubiquinol oxidase subunit II n=1 Tax=Nonomuraea helvata TaxID=37484 RepID=A0ABV5S316_9ACTN